MIVREGSPFRGVGVIALKEAADHLTSARMHLIMGLVLLTAIGAVYGAIGRIKDTTAEDAYLFEAFYGGARAIAFIRCVSGLPATAGSHRAWLRCDQRRIQSTHHEPAAGTADLSRRSTVRKVSRSTSCHRHRAAYAVAANDRARYPVSRTATNGSRRRSQSGLSRGDTRLRRRLARARYCIFGCHSITGDVGARRIVGVADSHGLLGNDRTVAGWRHRANGSARWIRSILLQCLRNSKLSNRSRGFRRKRSMLKSPPYCLILQPVRLAHCSCRSFRAHCTGRLCRRWKAR